MFAQSFKGTGALTKLILRQNRLKILIWLLCLVGITLGTAATYPEVYQTEEDVMAFALTMDNPAMEAMIGPGYELEQYNTATIFANEMLLFTIIAVAVMNILLIGRSTRADEEEGQMELVRSLPVGRLSYLTASFNLALIINTLLFIFVGFGLYSMNLDGMNLESTLLYGAILANAGFVFASFTALFAQLAETSRGTTGITFGVLIAAYLIRAFGDTSVEGLSYISPLGWLVRTDVFVENHWWPVILSVFLFVLLTVITFYLNNIRDMGAGFIPERKGRANASSTLLSPLGLAFRLEKITIYSWGIILFLLSAAFGAILGELETYFADMEILQVYLQSMPGTTMADQFVSLIIAIMSLISVIPVITIALKIKSEERQNRTELVYSRPVSRINYYGGYILLALFSSILFQLLIAFGLWFAGQSVMENALAIDSTFFSALVYLPAMWFVMGITVFFVGIKPKLTGIVWLYFAFCLIVVYLGDLLKLPDWMNNISVYNHIPFIPGEEVNWLTMGTLFGLALLVNVFGLIAYRNRDIVG